MKKQTLCEILYFFSPLLEDISAYLKARTEKLMKPKESGISICEHGVWECEKCIDKNKKEEKE